MPQGRLPDNPDVIAGKVEGGHATDLQRPWRRLRSLWPGWTACACMTFAMTSALHLPIPGSIPGLLGAAAYFAWRGGPTEAMGRMFDALIPFAPMLFVPAGAGFVAHIDLIATNWFAIIAAIILAAAGGLLATGLTAQLLLQRFSRRENEL